VIDLAWTKWAGHERRWPATVTVAAVLCLQLALPVQVTAGPRWLLPALEVALLAPVALANPVRLTRDTPWLRRAALALAGLVAAANAGNLMLLIALVVSGTRVVPRVLVQAALLIGSPTWPRRRSRCGRWTAVARSPATRATDAGPAARTCSSRR